MAHTSERSASRSPDVMDRSMEEMVRSHHHDHPGLMNLGRISQATFAGVTEAVNILLG